MFKLLAATGLRRSELLALEVRHLHLDGDQPHVKVRQRARWQKGKGQVLGALKSRHAHRDIPIPLDLADELRGRSARREPHELAFAGLRGPYDPHHIHARVVAPACEEAGVAWAGFHTFRHDRLAHVRVRAQRRPGPALARASLGGLHALDVRAPARWRSRRAD
jgi:integrase